MKNIGWIWILAASLSLLWALPSYSDTLIIKFRSGKTQEVTLEEKADTVDSIQFIPASQNGGKTIQSEFTETDTTQAIKEEKAEKKNGKNTSEKTKRGIRLKWNSPKFGE